LRKQERAMPRRFEKGRFRSAYEECIVKHPSHQEAEGYYPRYRSRYERLTEYYAAIAPDGPCDVLDIGGGQFSMLAKELWGDRGAVGDIDRSNLAEMEKRGLRSVHWNLMADAQPVKEEFDVIVMSEVIEHLAVPAHIVLERLRKALRPGGKLLLSTPNLHRLRNIVYLTVGKSPFDYFQYPSDSGVGHQLEYSRGHMMWQLQTAGFQQIRLDRVSLPHWPARLPSRVLKALVWPLSWIPLYRDILVAVATA
jgi:SAM-dependent methyltransferase